MRSDLSLLSRSDIWPAMVLLGGSSVQTMSVSVNLLPSVAYSMGLYVRV